MYYRFNKCRMSDNSGRNFRFTHIGQAKENIYSVKSHSRVSS